MLQRMIMTVLLVSSLVLNGYAAAREYTVQVGDVIRVSLPGEDSLDRAFDVDRRGRVQLPEVGAVNVAGISESKLEETLRARLKSAFRDLSNLHVYVAQRQLLVTVVGYVDKPGEVTLPADASIQMALQAAGGLRAGAQLDRLQLRRGEKRTVFNYKQYLDSGDARALPQLRSLDTVFVPASPMIGNVEVEFDPAKIADAGDAGEEGSAVKVFGEVNRPGSFSFKSNISLVDLIMRAGGVTRYAGVEQIRVITRGSPVLFNLKSYLDSGDESLLPAMMPGATIFVPRQEEAIRAGANTVYVMGEVFKPGAYEGGSGVSFMDILANAGGPTRFAESRQIRILKSDGSVRRFDLAGFTEGTMGGGPPLIEPGDAIFVPEKAETTQASWLKVASDRAVRVLGEVGRPGRIEWSNEMSLLDLLAHVGGPTSRADTSNIEIVAPRRDGSTRLHRFNLDAFMSDGGRESDLPSIVAGTTIRVHELPRELSDNKAQWVQQSAQKSIYVFGEVGAPGRYKFTNEMNFLDILSAADGPTSAADLRNIRISHREGKNARVSKLNLALYFETGDENLLPQVRTGDTIYLPQKNRSYLDKPKESTVRVLGAINKPGRYAFEDTMTLLDLLAEAGGTSAEAYVEKITVVNLSCCKNQARVFDLGEFSRTGDFTALPVLRAGDTVYVPNAGESTMSKAREGLRDVFQLISMAALLGFL